VFETWPKDLGPEFQTRFRLVSLIYKTILSNSVF
jgi:hypothetical protein